MGGLEQPRLLYLPQVLRPWEVFDLVASERLTSKLHGEDFGAQPQGYFAAGQSFLCIDLPMSNPGVS